MQVNKMAEVEEEEEENRRDGSINPPPFKKKRSLPGTPDPEAEVIALSPKTLMATNRFLCEICGKGFQRDQNLQLHRRGHNLPWKLKQRTGKQTRKRVYICPEKSCVHNNPLRALGDLTGIKKHFCRKHGEKKWKCDKCSKRYAVQSDCKAHSKTCGTREYKCDCGTIFSRRDSFITHRAFCEALAKETARVNAMNYHFIGPQQSSPWMGQENSHHQPHDLHVPLSSDSSSLAYVNDPMPSFSLSNIGRQNPPVISIPSLFSFQHQPSSTAIMSATALLQKATQIGVTSSVDPSILGNGYNNQDDCGIDISPLNQLLVFPKEQDCNNKGGETRDFLGVGVQPISHSTPLNGWI